MVCEGELHCFGWIRWVSGPRRSRSSEAAGGWRCEAIAEPLSFLNAQFDRLVRLESVRVARAGRPRTRSEFPDRGGDLAQEGERLLLAPQRERKGENRPADPIAVPPAGAQQTQAARIGSAAAPPTHEPTRLGREVAFA